MNSSLTRLGEWLKPEPMLNAEAAMIGARSDSRRRHQRFKSFSASKFWRNTRTEKHRPDDPLSTDPPRSDPPPKETTCGACGCRIARSGEILSTGETYKRFLKHEQTIEQKDREISALNAEVARLKEEIRTLTPSVPGSGGATHPIGRKIQ